MSFKNTAIIIVLAFLLIYLCTTEARRTKGANFKSSFTRLTKNHTKLIEEAIQQIIVNNILGKIAISSNHTEPVYIKLSMAS